MSLNRRLGCLERNAQNELTQRMRGEEERLRAHASPETRARYDAAEERMRVAYESTGADGEEFGDACDSYLDALECLDNERKVD